MEPASSGADTYFAPAERSDPESLAALAALAVTDPVIQAVLEAVGGLLMVLDEHRQILAANRELLDGLKVKTGDNLIGQRPGEALGCVHAQTGPGLKKRSAARSFRCTIQASSRPRWRPTSSNPTSATRGAAEASGPMPCACWASTVWAAA